MSQEILLPAEDSPSPSEIAPITPPVERRGVQNQGGFLTPYYLFELLDRQHGEELDPQGRESARRLLRRTFRQAMRGWSDLGTSRPTLRQTWNLWYDTLFQVLGFTLRELDTPVETARYGMIPISHAYYLHEDVDESPLLFIDLHPFGADLDQAHYAERPSRHSHRHTDSNITGEPISRAIEFALDHNQTRWALLSNGTEMRLYRKGGSIARQYLKIDFPALFDNDDDKEWLAFWGLFRLKAFVPPEEGIPGVANTVGEASQRCLLERVIEESQRHATRIADDLRANMVRAVEMLLQGVIDSSVNRHLWQGVMDNKLIPDEEQMKTLFRETIYFLYRLLFILYAESRDLLPVGDSVIYRDAYSLEHLREIAERRVIRPEDYDKTYYIDTLRILFTLLRNGYPARNPSAGDTTASAKSLSASPFVISPYNGQLFDPERTALLDQCHIPDRAMREVILELSLSHPKNRHERRERYSYADLGVDQLGSIYEGLLVYEPFIADQAMVDARIKGETRLIPLEQADDLELPYDHDAIKPAGSFLLRIWGGRRKGSGSYYTPQSITAFLVKDALAPLVEPIVAGCAQRDNNGKSLRSADEILKLKVCDPAMGSGAFLVQACRYLGEAYGRALIAEGRSDNERITPDTLARYKRRVAEKCIYGVDLNPLAVELAKVSLWLETLARDRPLTFLDAHLRCGNALIGAPLRNEAGKLDPSRLLILPTEAYGKATKEDTRAFREMLKELAATNRKQLKTYVKQIQVGQLSLLGGADLQEIVADYEQQRIELEESDENKSMEEAVALVHRKEEMLHRLLTGEESLVRRFKQLCDLWCSAWFWPTDADVPAPTTVTYYDLAGVIFERPGQLVPEYAETYLEIVRKLAEEEVRFFHWEVEFPEVWYNDEGQPLLNGGFDVIVGNPPWETVKPNSQEFWSNYLPTFRALGKQDALRTANELRAEAEIDTRWRQYFKFLSQQANVFRQPGFYTLQGGGDINTYKLFLERMVRLARPDGTFSIVVPSGIYTDKYSTPLRRMLFFQENTRYLLSIENRKGIFPIDSRMKVVLLSGQKEDGLPQQGEHLNDAIQTVACLFLVGKDHTGRDIAPSPEYLGLLLPQLDQLLLSQPTALIKKFAPTTLSLMEFKNQHDIEVSLRIYDDHPLLGERFTNAWNAPIRTEFHMSNNSKLFKTRPTGWPLWEGKMIYQFECEYAPPQYWIDEGTGIAELVRRAKIENYQSPQKWIVDEPKLGCANFRLVYRKVGRNTDEITLVAAILPPQHFIGHSIDEFVQWSFEPKPFPTWVKHFDETNKMFLMAMLNSLVLNFVIRQKVSANVSAYFVNQLPIPRLSATHPVSQAIVPLTARLTCIDERFVPLWEELAQHHPERMATQWIPECAASDPLERAHLRAEIDAHVADLYGLSEQDFAYILSTFPLLDRDQPALPGEPKSFITRDLALLTFFTLRGKIPPENIVTFFDEAGVDIRQQTGSILDLRERVRVALEELGAVAYQPSGHEQEEDELSDEESDEFEFDEE